MAAAPGFEIGALRAGDAHRTSPREIELLLDAPDIEKLFDADTKWDVVETVLSRRPGELRRG